MKMKLIRLLIFCVFCLISVQLSAQDEYRAEIGGNVGGSYYLGDANSQLFKNMQLAYSGFLRYSFDTRLAFKAELMGTSVWNQAFPNHTVLSTDFTGEFNFFDLEKSEYKQFSKIFSPYVFAGLGLMSYNDSTRFNTKISIPFGIGMKVKLGQRCNLNVQWTTRLLLADNLEGVKTMNNSGQLNGSNPFNNDLLSTLTVGISFDIWKKQCDCENSSVMKDKHKFKKK
jgi:hypothetical protein